MRLEPLYRLTFRYTEEWGVATGDSSAPAGVFFFIAEGRCSGKIVGVLDMRGYGRAYPLGARQVVVAVTHVSDHPGYTRLNDSLSVGCGEVRRLSNAETELVIDVSELIWEQIDA